MYSVYLAEHKISKKKVAMKLIKADSIEIAGLEAIQDEVAILKKLSHNHITKLLDSGDAQVKLGGRKYKVFYIALKLASGGELFDLI